MATDGDKVPLLTQGSTRPRATVFATVIVMVSGLLLAACSAAAPPSTSPPSTSATSGYGAFSDPQPVTITGYSGDAMEPFISSDGQYLFFNTLNDAPATSLEYATRVNSQEFTYVGP